MGSTGERPRCWLLCVLLLSPLAFADDAGPPSATVAEIGRVLDDFHAAAAHDDKARYLGLLTRNAVFMGTDEWERWPKHPDFTNYVDTRFVDGKGWTYRAVERNVGLATTGEVAWFDEVVFSESSGRFRGTGVLVLERDAWKIAHYALSFLVFNEDWDAVVELTSKTRAAKARE
jgi:hypothetical protein